MKTLAELERLLESTNKRHGLVYQGEEWGYLNSHVEDVAKDSFVFVPVREGIYRKDLEDFQFISAAVNALPALIKEIKAAREVVEQARCVSNFLNGRWCEDHAYRKRFLEPLAESIEKYEACK